MKKLALVVMCGALAAGAAAVVQSAVAQDASQGGEQQPGMRQGRGGGGMQGRGGGGGMRGGGMMGGPRVMGVVQSVGDKSITVKDEDGTIWTVDAGENTRVLKEREPAKFADLTKGQAVVAAGMAEPGKKEIHAMFISMLSAEEAQRLAAMAAKMKADLGKTYLVGKITKMDETRLTIMRPDGVEQVAAVDENSSLRRGGGMGGRNMMMGAGAAPAAAAAPNTGEPITLPDVKVGDNVSGTGEMKGSSFTFKELHVMTPRGNGGGQRRGNGAAPAGGADNVQQ